MSVSEAPADDPDQEGGGPIISKGLRYMAASALSFSVMSLCVKLAGMGGQPSQQLVLARAAIALVLSWAALRRLGIGWRESDHVGLLLMRGLLGFGGLSCFYYALTHLPLADATVIQFLNPILVSFLAAAWLGERIGRLEVGAALVSLAGVACVVQPSFLFGGESARLDMWGVAAALAGACVSAGAYTTVRALKGHAHPMLVVFYFPLIATPLAIPTAWPVLTMPDWKGWLLLAAIGASTQIAQIWMTKGLHLEPAGRATSMSYLQVVFAFVWGIVLLDEIPGALAIVGSCLILASSLCVALARTR